MRLILVIVFTFFYCFLFAQQPEAGFGILRFNGSPVGYIPDIADGESERAYDYVNNLWYKWNRAFGTWDIDEDSIEEMVSDANLIVGTKQSLGESFYIGKHKFLVVADSIENYPVDTIAVIPFFDNYGVYYPDTKHDVCLWGASPEASREENRLAFQSAIDFHVLSGQGKPIYTSRSGVFESYPVEANNFRYSGSIETNVNVTGGGYNPLLYTTWIFYPDPNRPTEKAAIRINGRSEIERFGARMEDGLDTLIRLNNIPFHVIEHCYLYASDDFQVGNPRFLVYANDLLYPKFMDNQFRGPEGGYCIYITSTANYYAINVGEVTRNDFFGRSTGLAIGSGTLTVANNTFEGFVADTVNAVRGAIEIGFDNFAGQIFIRDNYFEQSTRDSVYINAILVRDGNYGKITLEGNRAYGPRPDFGVGGYPADTLSSFFRVYNALLSELRSVDNAIFRYNYGHGLRITSGSDLYFEHNRYNIDSLGGGEIFRYTDNNSYATTLPLFDYNNSTPSGLYSSIVIDEPNISTSYRVGVNDRKGVMRLFFGSTVMDLSLDNHFEIDNTGNTIVTTINEKEHDELVIYAKQDCIFEGQQLSAGNIYEYSYFNSNWVSRL